MIGALLLVPIAIGLAALAFSGWQVPPLVWWLGCGLVLFELLFSKTEGTPNQSFGPRPHGFYRPRQDYKNQPKQTKSSWQPIDENSYWREVSLEPDPEPETPRVGRVRQINSPRVVPDNLRWFGLGADASKEDVHNAYRKRAKYEHPDGGGSHEKFIHLKERYKSALKEVR